MNLRTDKKQYLWLRDFVNKQFTGTLCFHPVSHLHCYINCVGVIVYLLYNVKLHFSQFSNSSVDGLKVKKT